MVQGPPEPKPLIVKIVEPPHDPTGIADVLIGSLGLTGAIVLMAIVLGVMFAGVLFWFRSRSV
jgi:ABC-type phosphate transport system permease subunit